MKRQLLCTLYLTFFVNVCVAQDLKTEIYRYVNEYRERNHRKPLVIDEGLEKGAQEVALRISEDGVLKHSTIKQINSSGACGEILARMGDKYPSSPVRGWVNSPKHNEAMLIKKYKTFGLGVEEKDGVIYYCMWFNY
jgi:uncharacterized protein YkwD